MNQTETEVQFKIDEETFYRDIFLRTNLLLTPGMQERLRSARVAIIGLGGIGGMAAEMIARCGIGRIGLSDIDYFEPSNLNRQLFSTFYNVYDEYRKPGDFKANVAAGRIRQINPYCEIDVIATGINNQNVEEFCAGADCIVCQPDKESIKVLVHRMGKKYSIPVVTASRVNCNGNRWTLAAKVWDYRREPDLPTFEETNHPELLRYSIGECTEEVLQEYDRRDFCKVRERWAQVIRNDEAGAYGLVPGDNARRVMNAAPESFHKMHIIAPIANTAGAMASIQVIKLLLDYPVAQYAVDFWNGEIKPL